MVNASVMSFEFVIPLRADDLLQKASSSQYVVDRIFPVHGLSSKLQDCKKRIKSEGSLLTLSSFDVFYSVMVQFDSTDLQTKQDAWELLMQVMTLQSSSLAKLLEGELDTDSQQTHLNALKMSCYLLCQFCQKSENLMAKSANALAVPGVKGRKKPVKSKTDNSNWEIAREDAVKALVQLLQLGINRLWNPPIAEEEFIYQVSNVCYKLLEDPGVCKNRALRDTIFQLLGILVKRFNHASGCTLRMLQLLQQFEHLANPLAQAVELFVNSFGVRAIVSEIMREVGRMDPKELARDTSATRTYAAFLVELSQCIPEVMLPNISVVMCLLDEESYTMRNSVLSVMGEMIVRILSRDDLDTKQKSTRDQFLDKLEDHIHDVNAFARSKVLQIWLYIVNERALPLSRQHGLLQLVIGRLLDKSSLVRKSATQLLTTMVKMNQLASQLTPEELRANYEKEKEKLDVMELQCTAPTNESPDGASPKDSGDELWSSIEAELKEAIKKSVNADAEEEEEETEETPQSAADNEETIDQLKGQVIDRLKAKDFQAAISLSRKINSLSAQDLEADEAGDEDDDEMRSDSDSSDTETTLTKEKKKLLNGLRNIVIGDRLCTSVLEVAAKINTESEPDVNIVNPLSKQQVLVHFLKDSLNFVDEVHRSIPIVCQLLGSKLSSDVQESIEFFVAGYEIGIKSCQIGIHKMLPLIRSKEQSIKNAVVEAYKKVYLSPNVSNPRSQAVAIAGSLISLTADATLGDLTSLTDLIQEFVRTGDLNSRVIQVLWEKFAMKIPQTTPAESRGALVLLGMAAGAEVEIVQSNIATLIKEGLGPRAEEDFQLAKDTCTAFTKLAPKGKSNALKQPFRLSQDHELFQRLSQLLVSGLTSEDRSCYIPLAEQAISVIYKLAEHPEAICAAIIRKQAAALLQGSLVNRESAEDESSCCSSSTVLTRFIFCGGHVAFNQLIHLDVTIFGELKRRRALKEEKQQAGKSQKNRQNVPVNASASVKAAKDNQTETTLEDEMGLAGAAAEDAEAEYIRRITETDIVTGNGNLLAVLQPFIVSVCANQSKFNHPDLQAAAALALTKFMIVSSEFCEDNLPLLFTILEKSPHPIVRANAVIAISDLTFRFPNLIEPWTTHIYSRLRDESVNVRKNTIIVLTRLILNDMIKVKGQISELAMCVIDDNPQIQAIAKQFFCELSKKGNAVYNILPDIISRLSDTDIGVEEEKFRAILKFLMSFIQKERQCESLVEKLCHRFRVTRVERQWRDLAFCLSLLSFNDKSIRKLQENYACFADKLSEQFVYECFTTIISGARKLAKPEAKVHIDELEQRIEQSYNKGVEEDETVQKANKATAAAAATRSAKKKSKSAGQRKKQSKARGAKKYNSEYVSDESCLSDVEEEIAAAKSVRSKKKPVLQLSSDDSDFDISLPPKPTRSERQKARIVNKSDEEI